MSQVASVFECSVLLVEEARMQHIHLRVRRAHLGAVIARDIEQVRVLSALSPGTVVCNGGINKLRSSVDGQKVTELRLCVDIEVVESVQDRHCLLQVDGGLPYVGFGAGGDAAAAVVRSTDVRDLGGKNGGKHGRCRRHRLRIGITITNQVGVAALSIGYQVSAGGLYVRVRIRAAVGVQLGIIIDDAVGALLAVRRLEDIRARLLQFEIKVLSGV